MATMRRESVRLRLLPARSIEETGLDPFLYGNLVSPKASPSPHGLGKPRSEALMKDRQDVAPFSSSSLKVHVEEKSFIQSCDTINADCKIEELKVEQKHIFQSENRKSRLSNEGHPRDDSLETNGRSSGLTVNENNPTSTSIAANVNVVSPWTRSSFLKHHADELLSPISEEARSPKGRELAESKSLNLKLKSDTATGSILNKGEIVSDTVPQNSSQSLEHSSEDATNTSSHNSLQSSDDSSSLRTSNDISADATSSLTSQGSTSTRPDIPRPTLSPSSSMRKVDARSRWKRAAHSVKFINHMTANIRSPSTVDEMLQQQVTHDDAGGVGAAAFEGAKTAARTRSKGRKGMEGLLVRQDRGFLTFFQDFYVACLKMPIGHFLIAVFLAPLALGLLFTPLYLLDVDGLSFNGVVPEDATTSPLVSARQRCLAFLNIFLYALSLSTTFGGAPVAARSPFCLLVANMNTLMAQFLFVFLSGAVFARMSQPSYPIRCSRKAIIKTDDILPVLGLEEQEKYRAFSVRLVLTGPSPCELVDVKICLTFRIFVTLPSGYVFCSTQDLEVVRPEVSYLRYGLMVRHIIDKKSPVYGHTMESLIQGDASFSLTVMGLERTSMQPVFHLEDYFVCDGDVEWEGDYEDFIHIDNKGQRVLDHSRIDHLKQVKAVARASQAVCRMRNLMHEKQQQRDDDAMNIRPSTNTERRSEPGREFMNVAACAKDDQRGNLMWPGNWLNLRKRKLLKSKSTSFTRADW